MDNSDPNNPTNTNPSTVSSAPDATLPTDQVLPDQGLPSEQPQPVPDYSSTPSQMQAEAGVQPMSTPTQDAPVQQTNPTPNPWDQPQSQQAPPIQPLPGEPQTTLPVGSIPTDSQGIPHFASQEQGVSSYSPFQNNAQSKQPPEPQTEESAPTDLSQLTANTNGQGTQSNENGVYTPPVANTDTLVVPGDGSATPTTITAEPKKGIPLIAIIGALLLLLVVAAASAYFILGIGQTQRPQQPASTPSPVPATTPTPTTPTPSPSDIESVVNDGSSDFGSLAGEEEGSEVFTGATSAADLIKARQAQSTSSGSSSD